MEPCAFDKLLSLNVPHIHEKIFLLLDLKSYKACMQVNSAWQKVLSSDLMTRKVKDTLGRQSDMEKLVSYLLPAAKNCRRQRDPRGGFKSAKSVAREIAIKCVKRNVSVGQLKRIFQSMRIRCKSSHLCIKFLAPHHHHILKEFEKEDLKLLNGVGIDLKTSVWFNFALKPRYYDWN